MKLGPSSGTVDTRDVWQGMESEDGQQKSTSYFDREDFGSLGRSESLGFQLLLLFHSSGLSFPPTLLASLCPVPPRSSPLSVFPSLASIPLPFSARLIELHSTTHHNTTRHSPRLALLPLVSPRPACPRSHPSRSHFSSTPRPPTSTAAMLAPDGVAVPGPSIVVSQQALQACRERSMGLGSNLQTEGNCLPRSAGRDLGKTPDSSPPADDAAAHPA